MSPLVHLYKDLIDASHLVRHIHAMRVCHVFYVHRRCLNLHTREWRLLIDKITFSWSLHISIWKSNMPCLSLCVFVYYGVKCSYQTRRFEWVGSGRRCVGSWRRWRMGVFEDHSEQPKGRRWRQRSDLGKDNVSHLEVTLEKSRQAKGMLGKLVSQRDCGA